MISLALFLGTFLFNLRESSPCLDGGDAGEFITSSFSLGIPHAPGFPLYSLIGKAIQCSMPFSTAAYRCHILSALIASALVVLFFQLLMRAFGSDRRWPALIAALFLATRPLFMEQARVAEVFGLNALFSVGILYCLICERNTLAAFLFGLGLGNHHILIVMIPLFIFPFFFPTQARAAMLRTICYQIIFFAVGLSIYIYLPLRAHAGPPVNFGNPDTWERFWAVITRREFGALSLHPAALPFRDGKLILEQTQQFFGRVLTQSGIGALVLMVVATGIGLKNEDTRWLTVVVLLGWLGLGWGFEIYSNLSPFSDIGQWRLERFYLLPLGASAILVALALDRALTRQNLWLGFLAGALLVQSSWGFWHTNGFRHNFVFRDFALSALRCAPKDSRVVIDRVLFDEPSSALLTTTVTEGKRPDVHFLYRPGTLFEPVYGKDFLDLSWEDRFRRQKMVEERILGGAAFPVRCLAFEKNNTPFQNPALEGILYREQETKGSSPPNLPLLGRGTILFREGALDYPSRLIAVHIPYFLGKAALDLGDVGQAKQWFNSAAQKSGGMAWLLSNIGGLYAQKDLVDDAAKYFEEAVERDPYFYEAQFGWGFVCLKKSDYQRAVRAFEAAVCVGPERADGFYMLGVAYINAGEGRKAIEPFERYLALNPQGQMASIISHQLEELKSTPPQQN